MRGKTVGLANEMPINPDWLMLQLAESIPENAIIVDEGLTGAKNLLGFFPLRDRYSYFGMVSGGIGWGIAAAVGVQLAQPPGPVVAFWVMAVPSTALRLCGLPHISISRSHLLC
ncbi:MAG: hypothetical protein Ct9H300mP13_6210 [Gammaproteobacteria bacterium]|nr:MAG: hypothetical protein Ct9H300mP13_6210 [Gammaproteobacteria bacterium]